MDAFTSRSEGRESHAEISSSSGSRMLSQNPYNIIELESTDSLLGMWGAKTEALEFPQNSTWPSPLDSQRSDSCTLHYDVLLHDYCAYTNLPSSPTSGWHNQELWQLQCAPLLVEYSPDQVASFFADSSMQPHDAVVSEVPPNIDSPQFDQDHSVEGFPGQICASGDETLETDSSVHENSSQPNNVGVMQTQLSDWPCDSNTGKTQEDISSWPYHRLLERAFQDKRELSLQEIYDWFENNTKKAANNKGQGWQKSIRHNLSKNEAFTKTFVTKENNKGPTRADRRWKITEQALKDGVQSTSKFCKDKTDSKPQRSRHKARSPYRDGRRAR
ncbi:forkhead domain-containing protein [Akanthomyces lecanii RCEF 1005]|uniref:Forkhead domain-containing protein n=1 Tax=Akanthomyces lecanii RCEF 1005 TaxID=1081108 RepID=A0A162ICM2_CORDF|nr:forkhead domain-containing protein [Akanthomyces lecanii RCEF 1005]